MQFRQVVTYSTLESITDYDSVAIPLRNVIEREGQDAIPSSRNIFYIRSKIGGIIKTKEEPADDHPFPTREKPKNACKYATSTSSYNVMGLFHLRPWEAQLVSPRSS